MHSDTNYNRMLIASKKAQLNSLIANDLE